MGIGSRRVKEQSYPQSAIRKSVIRYPRSAIRYPGFQLPLRPLKGLAGSVIWRYIWSIKDFTKLDAWQAAKDLAKAVYVETRGFPSSELFGLTSQMRRAAVSIASNLAEGSQRSTDVEFARFVGYARGSAAELVTQLVISRDVGFLDVETSALLSNDLERVRMMLQGLHRRLTSNVQTDSG